MELLQPATWADAVEARAARPGAVALCGGTDMMVEPNFDRSRPEHVLDLTRIAELARWERDGGRPRIGAGVTHSRLIAELGNRLPGLAAAVAALRAATGRPLTRIPVRPEHIVL